MKDESVSALKVRLWEKPGTDARKREEGAGVGVGVGVGGTGWGDMPTSSNAANSLWKEPRGAAGDDRGLFRWKL
jgi:hypothetical protein